MIRRIVIWGFGIFFCILWGGICFPTAGSPQHRYFLPVNPVWLLFFFVGSFGILFVAYLADKYTKKK
jgi:hypothetical protein